MTRELLFRHLRDGTATRTLTTHRYELARGMAFQELVGIVPLFVPGSESPWAQARPRPLNINNTGERAIPQDEEEEEAAAALERQLVSVPEVVIMTDGEGGIVSEGTEEMRAQLEEAMGMLLVDPTPRSPTRRPPG